MAAQSTWLRMLFILALAAMHQPAKCHEFLAHSPVLQFQLVSQIEHLFGEGAADARSQEVERRMRPMYDSLPKGHNKRLGQEAVRYALHRYFMRFHGWNFAGLRANTSVASAPGPIIRLDDRIPEVVKKTVHGHLEGHGFNLRDLANLAVMMELFVKMEVVERLAQAYTQMGFQTTDSLSNGEADAVINYNYVIQMLVGEGVPLGQVKHYEHMMDEIYGGWKETQVFISDTRKGIAFSKRHSANPFIKTPSYSFNDIVDMAQVINDKFGQFQNFECRQLKDTLIEREHMDSGRIRLNDFYALAIGGHWHFSEKAEYLRELGALDESQRSPIVIIANYLYSQSNCLASSHFYSICCLDECEDLLGHLEKHLGAPEAEPQVITARVASLPSSTVAAPRNLSTQLVSRLNEVADFHGGKVPLHGRLFAQWMHHAYPRECPYPHVGSKQQVGVTEWGARKGGEEGLPIVAATMTVDELQLYVQSSDAEPVKRSLLDDFDEHHNDLPHVYAFVEPAVWSDEEELFADRQHLPPWVHLQRGARAATRNVAMLVVLGAVVVQLIRGFVLASSAAGGSASYVKKRGYLDMEKLIV